MTMNDRNNERTWALTDRTMAPQQRVFARRMRQSSTEAERKLWWHLRHRLPLDGSHFRRQVQIGPYIADFACHRLKLVIEIDGSQHGSQVAKDEARTRRLESEGYRVLRFWNNEVLSNIEGVLTEIQTRLQRPSPPTPPHKGEGSRATSRADPPPGGGG
jgi:very-short-patch-repair endonuclease